MAAKAVPLRDRFWFFPAVLCGAAVLLAHGLIVIDERLSMTPGRVAGLTYQVGVSGSRDLLGAIAGSVLTAAATTFSITMAVLALTTSNFGPRLVRNFMADRGNQLVLGVFLATFLYAVLVLRSVRDDSVRDELPGFVPHLAVNTAVVLAVLNIAVLVYFIHHISDSIQISTLSGRVREDLRRTIEHLYPQAGTDAAEDEERRSATTADDVLPPGWQDTADPVAASQDGYVVSIDNGHVLEVAEREDVVVVLECMPGDHLVQGDLVARVLRRGRGRAGDPADLDAVRAGIVGALVIGTTRTPHQDVRFAVLQLVEIAVRALSPGTNDPFTAVNAVDDLGASLSAMAVRVMPSPVRLGSDGEVRLVAPTTHLEDIVTDVFSYLRTYAVSAPAVLHRALAMAQTVGGRSSSPEVRRRLHAEVEALVRAYTDAGPYPADLDQLSERARRVRRRLAVSPKDPAGETAT